ncbi:MAG TPA: VOC family protein, partial [Alphaproteobacteria bacterium]|nr:VOC family protein [Alphaproteobacteria bacterium]
MTEAAVAAKSGSQTAGRANEFRMLHTMIRVLDLDRSMQFYCGLLGMKELRRKDYPDGKFTNA